MLVCLLRWSRSYSNVNVVSKRGKMVDPNLKISIKTLPTFDLRRLDVDNSF